MKAIIKVNETNIRFSGAFVSLTDMARATDGDAKRLISRWLRNSNTIDFLGQLEMRVGNKDFKVPEFEAFKKQSGLNSFSLSVDEWRTKTDAILIKSVKGRYGGTYGHRYIAYHFANWISNAFYISFLQEYDQLLEEKYGPKAIDHQVKRRLAAINHHLHTDAIKANLLVRIRKADQKYVYASEVDMLNIAVFGMTAKQYNAMKGEVPGNLRDSATKEQLWTLMNLQVLNAEYMQQGYAPDVRTAMIKEKAEDLMIQAERFGVERLLKKKN